MAVISPDLLDYPAIRKPSPTATTSFTSAPSSTQFQAIYAEHLDLVWRSLRGLGVREASVEDAAQDVFLVVHRRFESFEARSSFRTWLFGIVLRVARNHRRTDQRKGGLAPLDGVPEVADEGPGPHEEAVTAEALRDLSLALDDLDEAKREVFVLAELEQMCAPEIAETLGLNVNTVYSRLRAARSAFEAAVERKKGIRR